MQLKWHDPRASVIEGLLSRGDRRLGRVLELVWRRGGVFQEWGEHFDEKLWLDAKSSLQEKIQDVEGVTPSYAVLKEWGPDHDKHFVVGVHVRDRLLAQGEDARLNQFKCVEFVEEPEERPYGIDSGFRDPSGNHLRLTQIKALAAT